MKCNQISVIHRLIDSNKGENYWFNGCAAYVMECLNEADFDYDFFAGVTGDVFTQHYTYGGIAWDGFSSYMLEEKPAEFVKETFAKRGYRAEYADKLDMQKVVEYIDKNVPVIIWKSLFGVIVGYEGEDTLLYISGDESELKRTKLSEIDKGCFVFVSEKVKDIPLSEIYTQAISEIVPRFSINTDKYCMGADAFRAWADEVKSGKFDGEDKETFDLWANYTNFVCVAATNGSCCHEFLKRARGLTGFDFLEEVSALYRKMAEMWGGDDNRNDPNSLEVIGGGFNITLETLQDKEKREKIAAKIYDFADVTDEIAALLKKIN